MFLNNRYHDPTLGTFISVDPLVNVTGEPYIYASGNPTTLSDPTGLCSTNSEEGAACYAKRYADGQQGHNRFIGRLWSIWYSQHVRAKHYVASFRDQPDTHGYAVFYTTTNGRPERAANDLADRAFVYEIARSIGGLSDTGNGYVLRPEEVGSPGQGDTRGPFRADGLRTKMGSVGWRPDLADQDGSPEGHVSGYIAFGYIYGENQSKAGLNIAEWDPSEISNSQQDFDLGLIGLELGQKLVSGDYSGSDLIGDLDAATAGSWVGPGNPPRIPPSGISPTTMRGNLVCGLTGLLC